MLTKLAFKIQLKSMKLKSMKLIEKYDSVVKVYEIN